MLFEPCDLTCLCSFRYRSPAFHVQSWYDEVKDYTYPYPHECNPWCPERCTGSMCTHYTQVKDTEGLCSSTLCVPLVPAVTATCAHSGAVGLCSITTLLLQIVWATTNKIGCAVNVCKQMNVWGEIWENAVYLVCNYSPK